MYNMAIVGRRTCRFSENRINPMNPESYPIMFFVLQLWKKIYSEIKKTTTVAYVRQITKYLRKIRQYWKFQCHFVQFRHRQHLFPISRRLFNISIIKFIIVIFLSFDVSRIPLALYVGTSSKRRSMKTQKFWLAILILPKQRHKLLRDIIYSSEIHLYRLDLLHPTMTTKISIFMPMIMM